MGRLELILRVLTVLRREAREYPMTVYALCFALVGESRTLPEVGALLRVSDSSCRFAAAVAHREELIAMDGRELLAQRGGVAYRWRLTARGEQLVIEVAREVYAQG